MSWARSPVDPVLSLSSNMLVKLVGLLSIETVGTAPYMYVRVGGGLVLAQIYPAIEPWRGNFGNHKR